jgi:hypothetical protein
MTQNEYVNNLHARLKIDLKFFIKNLKNLKFGKNNYKKLTPNKRTYNHLRLTIAPGETRLWEILRIDQLGIKPGWNKVVIV